MENNTKSLMKVGIFVDVVNLYRSGGQRMRYDVLREFASRDGAEPVRMNAYVSLDADRAAEDPDFYRRTTGFHSALRDLGYKVVVKNVQWYTDETGKRVSKANTDLELAVDALQQAGKLDRVLIASGDGDYMRVVQALQNMGCRVEVVGLDNVSKALRQEADLFLSGYLIPDLIPLAGDRQQEWGEVGSRVRGYCYWHHREELYGFMRFLKEIAPGLWLTDTRNPQSPYGTAFFHDSNLPYEVDPEDLPSRNFIFEFSLGEADRGDGLQATEINLLSEL
jgi:uncharacterized LabA/DUF88 family protein